MVVDQYLKPAIAPLTWERWADFEGLFGFHGAHEGCWCMWFKQTNAEFAKTKGDTNKELMKTQVRAGVIPGLLAYLDGRAAGWCAVEPRRNYPRLGRSPVLGKIDQAPVWSLVCFYIAPDCRRQGLSEYLLHGALDYVASQGGRLVEAYPVDPIGGRLADARAYHGLASSFVKAGFAEKHRHLPTRPVMLIRLASDRNDSTGRF